MAQRVTRSSSRGPAASLKDIEGWEVYRLEGNMKKCFEQELKENHDIIMNDDIKKNNTIKKDSNNENIK